MMSSITTKTGDHGTTSLFDGTRVSKDDVRIELIGELDALNALLGFCKAATRQQEPYDTMQRDLMIVMTMAATPRYTSKNAELAGQQTAHLSTAIDRMERVIHEMTDHRKFEFVLPGKNMGDAAIHIARAQIRTCERRLVTLSRLLDKQADAEQGQSPLPQVLEIYLNRLSDYFYCLSLEQ